MTCCQQHIYAMLWASADWSDYYNFVNLIAACDICCMSHPPASHFPVNLHYTASVMKITPPPRTHNRVVIVEQKIAAKNGIVAGRSYYFAEGWAEPCGSSGHSDKAKSQMHRGKTNLEFWWQKGDLYPSYTCTAWMERERKTNSEKEKMRTLRETGK